MAIQIKAAGFMVQDNDGLAIYGVGSTEAEAWAQTAEAGPFFGRDGDTISNEEAFDTQFDLWPATQALIDAVNNHGGMIGWSFCEGIACTDDEAWQIEKSN